MGRFDHRVAVITGAARGIGFGIAQRFASEGASIAILDLDEAAAQDAAERLELADGASAIGIGCDVVDSAAAEAAVQRVVNELGGIHILVNNAGVTRDNLLFKMSEDDWDAVINVHLKGTFATSRHAVAYWRARAKDGLPVSGRIINTTSVSGIYGNPGQTNYGAAKAGIAAFTNILALEVARYGVTVNAVAPIALTRMTENLGPAPETDEEREARSPAWIAPIATWLASDESAGVTGRVFEASGQFLAVAEGWVRGPRTEPIDDPTKLGPVVADLLAKARPNSGVNGDPGGWPQPQA